MTHDNSTNKLPQPLILFINFDKLIFASLQPLSGEGMQDLICKFVVKDGEEVGESVDVYHDHLIIKIGSEFIGVSVSKIEKVEAEKIYISDFDEKEAEEFGKKWVSEKSKPVSVDELKLFGFGESEKKEEESNTNQNSEAKNNTADNKNGIDRL